MFHIISRIPVPSFISSCSLVPGPSFPLPILHCSILKLFTKYFHSYFLFDRFSKIYFGISFALIFHPFSLFSIRNLKSLPRPTCCVYNRIYFHFPSYLMLIIFTLLVPLSSPFELTFFFLWILSKFCKFLHFWINITLHFFKKYLRIDGVGVNVRCFYCNLMLKKRIL